MTASTIIRCPRCQKQNRVRPVSEGIPRCANCHNPLPWIVSTGQAGFDAEINSSVPVVVDFWAPWCGPCRMISPALENLANQQSGRMKLVKVNVDENQDLARRYGAMSIPLLVLIEGGREIDRKVGALPQAQLAAWIEPRLATRAPGERDR